jgi:hypothetical protein
MGKFTGRPVFGVDAFKSTEFALTGIGEVGHWSPPDWVIAFVFVLAD